MKCLRRIFLLRRTETKFDRLIENCGLNTPLKFRCARTFLCVMNNDSNVQLIKRDEFAPLASLIFHLVMTTERNALKEEQLRQAPERDRFELQCSSHSSSRSMQRHWNFDRRTRWKMTKEKDGERLRVVMSFSR